MQSSLVLQLLFCLAKSAIARFKSSQGVNSTQLTKKRRNKPKIGMKRKIGFMLDGHNRFCVNEVSCHRYRSHASPLSPVMKDKARAVEQAAGSFALGTFDPDIVVVGITIPFFSLLSDSHKDFFFLFLQDESYSFCVSSAILGWDCDAYAIVFAKCVTALWCVALWFGSVDKDGAGAIFGVFWLLACVPGFVNLCSIHVADDVYCRDICFCFC